MTHNEVTVAVGLTTAELADGDLAVVSPIDGELIGRVTKQTDEDVVHVHVSAEGTQNGELGRSEFVRSYYPIEIDGRHWRAISWTTSSSVCAIIEMVNSGELPDKGFLHQEKVPLDAFLGTENGQRYVV